MIDITAQILAKKDEDCYSAKTGAKIETDGTGYMVDQILDRTGNKGTGKMTIMEGAEQATAVATMSVSEIIATPANMSHTAYPAAVCCPAGGSGHALHLLR